MRDRNHEDDNVAENLRERERLQSETVRRRFITLRDALLALAASMQKPVETTRSGLTRFRRPVATRDAVTREQREAELLQSLSSRSHPPAYAPQSMLESLVLQQARLKMWGVKAVMIDYAMPGSSEGINWRIAGFISGTAERDAACLAIAAAAHKYSKWVLVDDANPLSGQMVKLATRARGIA